jgi:hypothetical protein
MFIRWHLEPPWSLSLESSTKMKYEWSLKLFAKMKDGLEARNLNMEPMLIVLYYLRFVSCASKAFITWFFFPKDMKNQHKCAKCGDLHQIKNVAWNVVILDYGYIWKKTATKNQWMKNHKPPTWDS